MKISQETIMKILETDVKPNTNIRMLTSNRSLDKNLNTLFYTYFKFTRDIPEYYDKRRNQDGKKSKLHEQV